VIEASEKLNSEMPPPSPPTLSLIILPLIVGVPAAKIPTPSVAEASVLPEMRLFST
jgi:hypothetical protein